MIKELYQRNKILKFLFIPLIFYFIIFASFTYPLLWKFSSHLFADAGDGLQTFWDIWWVNKAVANLHQSPFYTNWVHFPYGVTMIAQTLHSFNGFMGIILLKFLTLIQVYNFVVIFSFVIGGLSAFYLSYYLTKLYWGSLIAGCVFTFSSFHFAHAQGHLQVVSLEWIPFFILCWFIFTNKPNIKMAFFSSISLFLVVLCDYYYFLYCFLAAVIIFFWQLKKQKLSLFLQKKIVLRYFVFFIFTLFTSGSIVIDLIKTNIKDPFIGAHNSISFSTDMLAPFIPGGHWRFADLTKNYWSALPGNIHEGSVYLGLSVIFMLIYVWNKRKKIKLSTLNLLYFLILFFLILSLGPQLQIWGIPINLPIPTPYTILSKIFPIIELSGVPVRMMVMVTLFAGILFGLGINRIFKLNKPNKYIAIIILIVFVIEYLPKPIPSTQIKIPKYVKKLKTLPLAGLIDLVDDPYKTLYFQTIHDKPIALGYISRTPKSVMINDYLFITLLNNYNFATLKKIGFRYYLSPENDGIKFSCLTQIQSQKNWYLFNLDKCIKK